jgi:hypothetical protein
MLTLCNILKESQDKVSSAVENSLRKQGIVVDQASMTSSKLSRAPTSQVALKAAALDRIEGLLTTVLDRLAGQASPAESPEGPSKSRNVTPRPPPIRKASKATVEVVPEPESGRSTPTVRAVDVQTQTRPVMQDTSIQADLLPPGQPGSDTSSPPSEGRIAAEREWTRQKLESKQVSHWSADVSPVLWRVNHLTCADARNVERWSAYRKLDLSYVMSDDSISFRHGLQASPARDACLFLESDQSLLSVITSSDNTFDPFCPDPCAFQSHSIVQYRPNQRHSIFTCYQCCTSMATRLLLR